MASVERMCRPWGAARVLHHQQVEIAVGMGFAASYGTEDANVVGTIKVGEPKYLGSPVLT